MAELNGAVGELRFTLTVTRKETGKTESVEMIGHILPTTEAPLKENEDVSHPLDRS